MSIDEEIRIYNSYNRRYLNIAQEYRELHRRFLQNFGDIHAIYREKILPLEAELIKILTHDSTDFDVIFAVYHYLLYSGYLSYGGKFTFGQQPHPVRSVSGMSVTAGKGVCLDISSHFTDLLRTLDSSQSFLLVATNSSASMARPVVSQRITYNFDSTSNGGGEPSKFLSDHAETCIYKGTDLYFYDPTNFLIFKHAPELKSVSNAAPLDVRANVFDGEFCLNLNKVKMLFEIMEKHSDLLNSAKRFLLPPCYLKELLEYGIDLCLSEDRVLEEFRRVIAEPYEKVYNIMK